MCVSVYVCVIFLMPQVSENLENAHQELNKLIQNYFILK